MTKVPRESLLISVCIPVYNGEKYIRESIECVLKQTEKNFELLVVDNCSTDQTLEIVSNYNEPRIKVFKNNHNLGLFGNFNKCIEISQGDFIVLLPHDDILLPRMLETFSKKLISDDQIGLVYSSYYRINSTGEEIDLCLSDFKSKVMSGEEAFRRIISGSPIQCAMVRKEIFSHIGFFDPLLTLSADVNMWCRIALAGYKFAFIFTPQNAYRIHSDSMTHYISSNGELGYGIFESLKKTFNNLPPHSDLHRLRYLSARWLFNSQFVCLAEFLVLKNWSVVKKNIKALAEIVCWIGIFKAIPCLFVALSILSKGLPRWIIRVLK